MALYTPNPLLSGEAAAQDKANFAFDQWRNTFDQGVDTYGAGQKDYAQALADQYFASQLPGIDIARQDSRRQQGFSAARRGVRGGSQDASEQARIEGAAATATGQARAGADAMQRSHVAGIDQYTSALKGLGMASGQMEQPLQQQLAFNASNARVGQAQANAGFNDQAYQDRVQRSILQSQITGGQLTDAGRFISNAGEAGVGPQWMQNWSSILAGG